MSTNYKPDSRYTNKSKRINIMFNSMDAGAKRMQEEGIKSGKYTIEGRLRLQKNQTKNWVQNQEYLSNIFAPSKYLPVYLRYLNISEPVKNVV